MTPAPAPAPRLASLDQFRGYTVLGMFVVNFVGGFKATPPELKHLHTHFGYADSIMPQFLFAVGFALRLTFLRRLAADGPRAAYGRAVRRCLGLALLAVVVYHLDGRAKSWDELCALGPAGVVRDGFQRSPFQALSHIALATLLALPVVASGAAVRVAFLVAAGAAYTLVSEQFYYAWVMKRPGIDGGPLGFVSWVIPLLVGSLAYDLVAAAPPGRPPLARLLALAAVVMGVGYGLSCLNTVAPSNTPPADWAGALVEPPFVPPTRPVNLWTMSQRAGSVSYTTFGAGFALAVYAWFAWAADARGWKLGLFDTFGRNALAGYLLHDLVADAIKPYAPADSPGWYVAAAAAVFLAVTWAFLKSLENQKVFIRL